MSSRLPKLAGELVMAEVRLLQVTTEMNLEVMAVVGHASAHELLEKVADLGLFVAPSRAKLLAGLCLVRIAPSCAELCASLGRSTTGGTAMDMVCRRTECMSDGFRHHVFTHATPSTQCSEQMADDTRPPVV